MSRISKHAILSPLTKLSPRSSLATQNDILTKKSFISIKFFNFLTLIISEIEFNCSNRFKTFYYPKVQSFGLIHIVWENILWVEISKKFPLINFFWKNRVFLILIPNFTNTLYLVYLAQIFCKSHRESSFSAY